MFFSGALSDAWNGLLQYAITDLAHLMHDGFWLRHCPKMKNGPLKSNSTAIAALP
jgi:hypothetical protein